jgi:tetratricopeptide (TPR) repeat protein
MSGIRELIDNASAQCSQRECEAAIRSLEGAAQQAPEDWWIQYKLGYCLTGRCRHHSLEDPDEALYRLQKALSLSTNQAPLEQHASILAALGNIYLISRQLPLKARVTAAVECQEKAAAIYKSNGDLERWAREQYNLGNAWCDSPPDSFPDKWQRAIEHYTAALQIWTRDREARRHAKTLQNLGTAFRELKTGDRESNVRRALSCYRQALHIYRKESPRENASVHNNIGNALLSLVSRDPKRSIRRATMALRHFEQSLAVVPKEQAPDVYAIAQFNCGQALLRLAAGGENPGSNLGRARVFFAEARNWFLDHGPETLAESARERLIMVANFLTTARGDQAASR